MKVLNTDELLERGHQVKACPFCGSLKVEARSRVSWYIECQGCYLQTQWMDSLSQAMACWNERVSVPAVALVPSVAYRVVQRQGA